MGSPAPEPYRPGRPKPPESTSGPDSDFEIEHGFFSSPAPPSAPAREPLPSAVRTGGPQFLPVREPIPSDQAANGPQAPARDPELGNRYDLHERASAPPAASDPEPACEPEGDADPVPVFEFIDHEPKTSRERKNDRQRAIVYTSPLAIDEPETPKSPSLFEKILRNPPLQVAVLVGVLGFAWGTWQAGRNRGLTSVHTIRRHAREYDGRQVKVRGRVGDVFPVGDSYAFNLLSGRDTLVVFTRTRVPVTSEKVLIAGSVSTGILEGIPRPALFETQP